MGDSRYSEDLFGGNILAPRGELLGEGSYAEAVEYLGVTGLRFPGGSLTEYSFDLSNPDAETAYDVRSDQEVSMIGLSDFMAYAEDTDQPVTIVIPTRTQLSTETDANGDRFTNINEGELREFIGDVAAGEYGSAEIQAIEIGNEYWGSGEMNAVEYGRLASEMATIVNNELSLANNFTTDIVVQKGNNFSHSRLSDEYQDVSSEDVIEDLNAKYGTEFGDDALFASGSVNWGYVNTKLVLSSFDTELEKEAVDGVVTHIYSRGEANEATRYFDLDQINDTWVEDIPGIEVYITEWNLKSDPGLDRDEDYGLYQAQEMLQIMEEFGRTGVDKAHVWPLIQNTRNALAEGLEFDSSTPSGEMFALMSETLPGKVLLDFQAGHRDTETEFGDVSVHMFAGEGELAIYVLNGSKESAATADIDFSGLISDYDVSDILVLGVEDDVSPGSNSSRPVIEEVEPSVMEDGTLEASLSPGEIMQVILSDIVPTDGFSETWLLANSGDPFSSEVESEDDPIGDIPDVPILETDDEESIEEFDSALDDDDGILSGLGWAGGLLLLLATGAGGLG